MHYTRHTWQKTTRTAQFQDGLDVNRYEKKENSRKIKQTLI